MDAEKLARYIKDSREAREEDWLGEDADEAVERFHQYVEIGCRRSMPRRGATHGHRPAYLWNEDIAEKRRRCIVRRRAHQRQGRTTADREEERISYIEAKKDLRMTIKRSQERAWAKLVAGVERDVWGIPYRLVTRKLVRHLKDAYTKGRKEEIARHLFPRASMG